MKQRTAEALLALALTLRGSSLLFGKIAVRTMGPFLLIGTRFLIGFVLIALLFHRKLKGLRFTDWWHSAVLGLMFVAAMGLELYGLRTTASSTAGFLENSVVVIVPLILCLIRRRLPERNTVLSAVVAMGGVLLLTGTGLHFDFSAGELLIMLGATCYSGAVIITDYVCKRDDPGVVAVLQLFWIGVFAMIAAFLTEEPRLPATATEWGAVLWLAVVCSGVGFTLQPYAQKYTTAERSGLFGAFNPIAAGFFGMVFLGERFTPAGLCGCALILLAVALPTLLDMAGKKRA